MTCISEENIRHYQEHTFRLAPGERLHSVEQAIEYVNQRGFIFFWPIRDITLPSLWSAVAGNRPVADEHDDPGHVTWDWKDSMLDKRVWYYAKILRNKSTLVSLDVAPNFYALSENYGSPEEDFLVLYQQGKITQESKLVFEAILKEGPSDTISLRRLTHLTSRDSDGRFNKALTDLQAGFQILPVGVSQAGRWHYSFIYDLVHRHFPEVVEQARYIGEHQARRKLVELYLGSVGATREKDLIKLFGWTPESTQRAIEDLARLNIVDLNIEIENQPGEWIVLHDLIEQE